MTTGSQPKPTGIRTTEIRVPGANCTLCFNDAIDKLRHTEGVTAVRASILSECVELQHLDVPTTVLIDTLQTYLHGSEDSSHECQMVPIEPQLITHTVAAEPADQHDRADATVPMETLSEAMRRLRAAGYISDFSASPEGNLVCRSCHSSRPPESIEIRETVRFEGDSNPDDEAILFALSGADGCLGQYSVAFGPGTPPSDVLVLHRLGHPGRGSRGTRP